MYSDKRRRPANLRLWLRRLLFIGKHHKLIAANYTLAAHEMRDMGLFAKSRGIPNIVRALKAWVKECNKI